MSAERDELHRTLKIGGWDRRILRRYFLIRPVIDTVPGELLPVPHRVAAESAIAVIYQQRPGTSKRRFYCISRRIPRCFWHDFNHNSPDSRALTCTILRELYDPASAIPGSRDDVRERDVPHPVSWTPEGDIDVAPPLDRRSDHAASRVARALAGV